MRKIILSILILLFVTSCFHSNKTSTPISNLETSIVSTASNNNSKESNINDESNFQTQSTSNEEINMEYIYILINENKLQVKLEQNNATKELINKLKVQNITITLNEYGGFEKVGSLGFSLTRSDKQITTQCGDIVLYAGNQMSIFYNSNSWSYTRLGKICNLSSNEIKNVLGNGNVVITLSIN